MFPKRRPESARFFKQAAYDREYSDFLDRRNTLAARIADAKMQSAQYDERIKSVHIGADVMSANLLHPALSMRLFHREDTICSTRSEYDVSHHRNPTETPRQRGYRKKRRYTYYKRNAACGNGPLKESERRPA